MNYLLDTHTLLWTLFSSKDLSPKSSKIIFDSENNIYASLVSFWEISLKYSLGKILLNNILPEDLPEITIKAGYEIFPINEHDVSTFYKLPRIAHKDPFDRLLIWQGIKNNLIIISKDNRFKDYSKFGLSVIW
ncbi:MAG: type II toxin-antitoxin system VapC family toxin [Spirochaetota bacterium]|nr:type II toxin-antitoxin system VapC family toxin [Spirochaetota bacterium]